MVLLAKDISNYAMQTLGLTGVEVGGHAFGSQIHSDVS
jgi:glutamine amidotransferase PdxT